jgi:hypothetical protein
MILGGLLLFANSQRIRRMALALFFGVCFIPMFLTGKVRDLSWQEMSVLDLEGNKELPPFELPLIAHVPRLPTGNLVPVGERVFSNELFAAHFSLYGIRRLHVEPAPFISASYLGAAMVPRMLKAERPPTAYDHYADQAQLLPGQGYTIHHAAGWYINGGWFGLALGGLMIGAFWGSLMRVRLKRADGPLAFQVFAIMGASCWVAFLPILVRDGPEIYKALVFEGFILPMGIVYLACLSARWFLPKLERA